MADIIHVPSITTIKGVDYRSNYLKRKRDFLTNGLNNKHRIIEDIGEVHTKRDGRRVFAQPLGTSYIGHYSYFDIKTGKNEDRILGVNGWVFELRRSLFRFDSIYPVKFELTYSENIQGFYFTVFKENSETVYQINAGNGLSDSSYTIGQLFHALDTIEGVTTFPYQIENSTRAFIGSNGTSEQTISNGEFFYFTRKLSSNVRKGLIFSAWCNNTESFRLGIVVDYDDFTTPGTIGLKLRFWDKDTYNLGNDPWILPANAGLGIGACPLASINILQSILELRHFIEFYAWVPVYHPHFYSGSIAHPTGVQYPTYINVPPTALVPATFTNAEQAIYITSYNRHVAKYDGLRTYHSGAKVGSFGAPSIIDSGTVIPGGVKPGTYRYRLVPVYTDNNGITVYGNASFAHTVTLTTDSAVTLNFQYVNDSLNNEFRNHLIQEYNYTATINKNFVEVGNRPGGFPFDIQAAVYAEVGEKVYIQATYPQSGEYGNSCIARNIIEIQDNRIVVEGGTFSTHLNAPISFGGRLIILRTKGDGAEYYEVGQIVLDNRHIGIHTYIDNYPGSDFDTRFELPLASQERYAPPKATFLTNFEGRLFYGGDPENPNKISYSLASGGQDSVENVPPATNNFVITTKNGSQVSALSTDTAGRVVVFCTNSIYHVGGNFGNNELTVDEITTGRYGVNSQSAIAKVGSGILAVGEGGIFALNNGVVSAIGYSINNELLDRGERNYRLMHIHDDYLDHTVQFNVSSNVSYVLDYTLTEGLFFNENYDQGLSSIDGFSPAWWRWATYVGMAATGGSVISDSMRLHISNGRLAGSSRAGHLFRTYKDYYNDNHLPVNFFAETADMFFDDFEREKVWRGLTIYSKKEFNKLAIRLKYWETDNYIHILPNFENDNIYIPFDSKSSKAIKFRVENYTLNQNVYILGHVIEVTSPFVKDRIRDSKDG